MRVILILAIPGLLVCFLVFKPQPALADDDQDARANENASENRQANQGNGAQTSFNNSQNSATTTSGLASTTPPTTSQTASSSMMISTSTGSGAAASNTAGTSTQSTGTTTLLTASTTATSASTSLSYASSSDSNATTSQSDDEEYIDDGIYFYLFEDGYEDEEGDSGHSMNPRIYSGKRNYEKGEIGVIFGTYLHPISTYNLVIFKYFDGKPSEKEVITIQADAVGNIYSLYTMDSDAEYYRVYLTSYDGYPLDRTWFWVGEDV